MRTPSPAPACPGDHLKREVLPSFGPELVGGTERHRV